MVGLKKFLAGLQTGMLAGLLIFGCNRSAKTITENGVVVEDVVIGSGQAAKKFDILTVDFTGKMEDGTVFDSSKNPGREPFRFTLGTSQVIEGWNEGLIGIGVGGRRRLTIPPKMGYGSEGFGKLIPPNSTLVFEVELLGVE